MSSAYDEFLPHPATNKEREERKGTVSRTRSYLGNSILKQMQTNAQTRTPMTTWEPAMKLIAGQKKKLFIYLFCFAADSCARVDAVFIKRSDSKGHVKGSLLFLIFVVVSIFLCYPANERLRVAMVVLIRQRTLIGSVSSFSSLSFMVQILIEQNVTGSLESYVVKFSRGLFFTDLRKAA